MLKNGTLEFRHRSVPVAEFQKEYFRSSAKLNQIHKNMKLMKKGGLQPFKDPVGIWHKPKVSAMRRKDVQKWTWINGLDFEYGILPKKARRNKQPSIDHEKRVNKKELRQMKIALGMREQVRYEKLYRKFLDDRKKSKPQSPQAEWKSHIYHGNPFTRSERGVSAAIAAELFGAKGGKKK